MDIDLTKLTLAEIIELKEKLSHIHLNGMEKPATQEPKTLFNPVTRKRAIDYTDLDWSKTDAQLAQETGLCRTTVGYNRQRLGKEKVSKFWPACKTWDWTKSNTEIARATGATINTVKNYRLKLNLPDVPPDRHRSYVKVPTEKLKARFDWKAVDWNKADIQLAREMGCSRERVRQKRAELKMPKRYMFEVKFDEFKAKFAGRESITMREVRESGLKISNETVWQYCARLGIQRSQEKPYSCLSDNGKKYRHMNWKLPNLILAQIWGANPQQVANRRCTQAEQSPLFRFRSDKNPVPEQYRELVEAEKTKFEAYEAEKSKENSEPPPTQSINYERKH